MPTALNTTQCTLCTFSTNLPFSNPSSCLLGQWLLFPSAFLISLMVTAPTDSSLWWLSAILTSALLLPASLNLIKAYHAFCLHQHGHSVTPFVRAPPHYNVAQYFNVHTSHKSISRDFTLATVHRTTATLLDYCITPHFQFHYHRIKTTNQHALQHSISAKITLMQLINRIYSINNRASSNTFIPHLDNHQQYMSMSNKDVVGL